MAQRLLGPVALSPVGQVVDHGLHGAGQRGPGLGQVGGPFQRIQQGGQTGLGLTRLQQDHAQEVAGPGIPGGSGQVGLQELPGLSRSAGGAQFEGPAQGLGRRHADRIGREWGSQQHQEGRRDQKASQHPHVFPGPDHGLLLQSG